MTFSDDRNNYDNKQESQTSNPHKFENVLNNAIHSPSSTISKISIKRLKRNNFNHPHHSLKTENKRKEKYENSSIFSHAN